jgi:hypothetical protein
LNLNICIQNEKIRISKREEELEFFCTLEETNILRTYHILKVAGMPSENANKPIGLLLLEKAIDDMYLTAKELCEL